MKFQSEAHRIIVHELERHTKRRLDGIKRVMIPCPFHKEVHPSLAINLDPHNRKSSIGGFFCFGCKASAKTHGGWNALAKLLGLAEFEGGGQVTQYVTRAVDVEKFYEDNGWTLQTMMDSFSIDFYTPWPEDDVWRKVPGWLIRKLGGFLAFNSKFQSQMCVLPQYTNDTIVGGIQAKCHVTSKTRIKYLNTGGEWTKTRSLYPFHLVEKMLKKMKRKYVVLVEGPRDAIRLIGFGIPALAILGSNNWSDEKRDLLITLDLDMVLFAFDNDKGGKLAYKNCAPGLKGYVHRAKIKITGEDKKGVGYDPGNVPAVQIYSWIKKWKLETVDVSKFKDFYPAIEEDE